MVGAIGVDGCAGSYNLKYVDDNDQWITTDDDCHSDCAWWGKIKDTYCSYDDIGPGNWIVYTLWEAKWDGGQCKCISVIRGRLVENHK